MTPAAHHHATLTAALEYAERGWPVFPCHSILATGCTCSRGHACDRAGKHPRIPTGRNGASTDPATIEHWWHLWPASNVAIVTGQESGLVVVDLDSDEATAFVGRQGVPLTLEQRTGSGGTHILFQRPPGERYRTTTGVAGIAGLDSRADGGYIIAPPSLHISGGIYEWNHGVEPAPCPEWWADLIRAPAPAAGHQPPPEWNPDGQLPPDIIEILAYIPAEEYTTWRDVGLALHYADPSTEGLGVYDWWSSTAANYDAEAVRREWRNYSRRGHAVDRPITLARVRQIAESLGWANPDLEHGAAVGARLMESAQLRIAEQLEVGVAVPVVAAAPEHLIPERGLIGDIARWIESTAIRPQPRLAFAAATAFVGALAGRRYASPTNLRTNLYLVGLAPTGAGKNHARGAIHRLATAAQVDEFLGADHIASGSAIVNGLKAQPVKLYMLDEFGLLLQSLTGAGASGHRREIIARLLELYSLAQSSYRGVEYADSEARPRTIIHNPHVCVYGTSTAASFWPALAGSHVHDGTLNRLMVIDTGDEVPARLRSVGRADPPADLVQMVRALATAQPGGRTAGNLRGLGGSQIGEQAHEVPMSPDVAEAEYQFACQMDRTGTTEGARAIYSRVSENAIKLALLHAISVDPERPEIDAESWTWGRDVATWCANVLVQQSAQRIANNDTEARLKQVYAMILAAGPEGITQRDLWRRTQAIAKRDRLEALETLETMGGIGQRIKKAATGPGRPSRVFVALADDLFSA